MHGTQWLNANFPLPQVDVNLNLHLMTTQLQHQVKKDVGDFLGCLYILAVSITSLTINPSRGILAFPVGGTSVEGASILLMRGAFRGSNKSWRLFQHWCPCAFVSTNPTFRHTHTKQNGSNSAHVFRQTSRYMSPLSLRSGMSRPQHQLLQADLCLRTAPIIFVTAITHDEQQQKNLVKS